MRKSGELCACEIQAALGLSHPAVSYHMSMLVQAGLVRSERRGKWIHYTLTPEGQRLGVCSDGGREGERVGRRLR